MPDASAGNDASTGNSWIDISLPLRNGMVQWPGDERFHRALSLDRRKGDICTLSHIKLSAHTGTHIDAPRHFVRDAPTIDDLPLDTTVGPARVIAIRDRQAITRQELLEYSIQAGERILFRTANSDRLWSSDTFSEDFIYIDRDAGKYLAQIGVRCVGIDSLSVDPYSADNAETHIALLGAGVWIIEGLNLSGVEAGDYELICLPLRLMGSEGAPARAIIRALENPSA